MGVALLDLVETALRVHRWIGNDQLAPLRDGVAAIKTDIRTYYYKR